MEAEKSQKVVWVVKSQDKKQKYCITVRRSKEDTSVLCPYTLGESLCHCLSSCTEEIKKTYLCFGKFAYSSEISGESLN